jgi:hypothetical protein
MLEPLDCNSTRTIKRIEIINWIIFSAVRRSTSTLLDTYRAVLDPAEHNPGHGALAEEGPADYTIFSPATQTAATPEPQLAAGAGAAYNEAARGVM